MVRTAKVVNYYSVSGVKLDRDQIAKLRIALRSNGDWLDLFDESIEVNCSYVETYI